VEYKNTKVEQVKLPSGGVFHPKTSRWVNGVTIAKKIQELSEEELPSLRARFATECKYKRESSWTQIANGGAPNCEGCLGECNQTDQRESRMDF
jgi:hypothetical protein